MLNSGIIDFLSSNLLILIGAYLIGSVSFGLVLTRVFVKQDIRKVGSGNIGATNVLRTGNKFLALLTLLLDGGKGSLAIFIAVGFLLFYFKIMGDLSPRKRGYIPSFY